VHILFLTDNFPPEVNAPASRTFEHARQWVASGARVTVVTGAPNFPAGRVFAGYRNRLIAREIVEGVEVVRVWTYITANAGFVRRTLDYLSFMVMGSVAALRVRGPDIVVATSPQFFTACAGWAVSRLKRIPFVFEVRDIWPESIAAVGAMRDGRILRLFERIEMFLYRQAKRIVVVTHAFKARLGKRGIDPGKIGVVTNGADLSRYAPAAKPLELEAELGLQGCFVAGYIGTVGMAHGLDTLIDAAALLDARPEIRLVILGDGAEKARLAARVRNERRGNVIFVDSVPKAEVARYWALLDLCLIHLRDTALFEAVIPSKLFEAMAMGVPVLHGVRGESASIVEGAGCGRVFAPGDAEACARAIRELADDRPALRQMSENALAAAPAFDRTALAEAMLGELNIAVGKKGTATRG
jgi:glycosyltransferase involved in cell wall biosynthesis